MLTLLAILYITSLCMFPQVLQVRVLNLKKKIARIPYFEVTRIELACVPIYFHLNCKHFYASYWPLFAFWAIFHVCTWCLYPQVSQQGV